jgi:ABC-type Fe3+-hydroxamate transport system substrate-binding protein
MKLRFAFIIMIMMLVLSACGSKAMEEPMTLSNQEGSEVTFPQEKPTVFFFITSYG